MGPYFRVITFVLMTLIAVSGASASTLTVAPVYQIKPDWCWAAVGEMVFKFFGVPNPFPTWGYQCSILNGLGGACLADCSYCSNQGGGTVDHVASMLQHFPDFSHSPEIHGYFKAGYVNMATVMTDIDNNRPIVAGVTPSGPVTPGVSEHAVLIVGYDNSAPNHPLLVINDPFPYALTPIPNPYTPNQGYQLRPGQFKIPYANFVQNLNWNTTIYDLHQDVRTSGPVGSTGDATGAPLPVGPPPTSGKSQATVPSDGFCDILSETENSLASGAGAIIDQASIADHQLHKSHALLTTIIPAGFDYGHVDIGSKVTMVYYYKKDDNASDATNDFVSISNRVQACFPGYSYENGDFTESSGFFTKENTYSNSSFAVTVLHGASSPYIRILVKPDTGG